jgi:hypothetical protein
MAYQVAMSDTHAHSGTSCQPSTTTSSRALDLQLLLQDLLRAASEYAAAAAAQHRSRNNLHHHTQHYNYHDDDDDDGKSNDRMSHMLEYLGLRWLEWMVKHTDQVAENTK